MGPAESAATAAGFQYLVDVRARRFDGGNNPEDQTGKQRNEESEPEDTSVAGKINRAIEKEQRGGRTPHKWPPQKESQGSPTRREGGEQELCAEDGRQDTMDH